MNDMPLVLSGSGAVLSFLTMLIVAIVGWLFKYILASTDRRLLQLETKSEMTAGALAAIESSAEDYRRERVEAKQALASVLTKVDTLTATVAELNGYLRHQGRE